MSEHPDYLDANRDLWNKKTPAHLDSDFYDLPGFLSGKTSLKPIELALLGDVSGLRILHLQCHFGQDSLSLARMGARVTGIDLSDVAIARARELNEQLGLDARFIVSDVYDLPNRLDETFDLVFSSYGVIGWLPDMPRWAGVIDRFLRPGGRFVFVEFHPVVWMFDEDYRHFAYSYFNQGLITTEVSGTYADREAKEAGGTEYSWNHPLSDVLQSLLDRGLRLTHFQEYDYSPYDCFPGTVEDPPGQFRIRHLGNRIPMLYSLTAKKP